MFSCDDVKPGHVRDDSDTVLGMSGWWRETRSCQRR